MHLAFSSMGPAPGALGWQPERQEAHAFAGLFALLVVLSDPGLYDLTDTPGSAVPDQQPSPFALSSQTLATPVEKLGRDVPASADQKAQLVRIQCKSARLSKDSTCLFFNTYNLGGEGKRQRRSYRGDAEFMGIYNPELRKVYLINIIECPVGNISLRLIDTNNKWKNQYSSQVRWARDYEI
jgi:PD-(D/E)XK endonuclease